MLRTDIPYVGAGGALTQAGFQALQGLVPTSIFDAIAALESRPLARALLATKTASSSANLSFTETDNAAFRFYEFELENVKPDNDGVNLFLRFSTNGGSSYDFGASDYGFSAFGLASAGMITSGSNAANAIQLAGGTLVGNDTGERGISGTVKIYNAPVATQTRVLADLTFDDTAGVHTRISSGGRRNADQTTNAFRFLFAVGGNIASGTIRMYGVP